MGVEFADFSHMDTVRDIPDPVYADYVLEALHGWRLEGLRTALVTLVGIDGSSPRPLGSQIAVAEDGRAIGAVTGGCVEQAVIRDALTAIACGKNHAELYGKGSRFKDITLPCGSGVHLYFDVTLTDAQLQKIVSARLNREVSVYTCEGPNGKFERRYRPKTRMVVFGRGNVLPPLVQMANLSEFETLVFCPDEWTRDLCAPYSAVFPLTTPNGWNASLIDAETAVVSLFHEHAYEPEILDRALRSNAFFIGALGSRRTHTQRCRQLRDGGWSDQVNRINGPIGLDIGAMTPPEIAVSVLAQVISYSRSRTYA
jgi:xanthine dehydrogenase accessory factor